VDDVGIMFAEERLRSRADSAAVLQLLTAAHGDPCYLGGKSVDQLAFLFQKALRDQHGHCHVLMAGFLEFAVHDPLHILPDGVAIGAQDGKALDGGVLHQLGLPAHVRIPLRKIDLHVGDLLHLFLFCHISSSSQNAKS